MSVTQALQHLEELDTYTSDKKILISEELSTTMKWLTTFILSIFLLGGSYGCWQLMQSNQSNDNTSLSTHQLTITLEKGETTPSSPTTEIQIQFVTPGGKNYNQRFHRWYRWLFPSPHFQFNVIQPHQLLFPINNIIPTTLSIDRWIEMCRRKFSNHNLTIGVIIPSLQQLSTVNYPIFPFEIQSKLIQKTMQQLGHQSENQTSSIRFQLILPNYQTLSYGSHLAHQQKHVYDTLSHLLGTQTPIEGTSKQK